MNELLIPTGPIEFGRVRCTSSHAHVLDTLSVLPDFPESMYFPGKIVRFGLYIPHEAGTTTDTAPEALAGVIVSGLDPHAIRFIIKSQHRVKDPGTHIRMKSDIVLDHQGDHSLMTEISSFCVDLGVDNPQDLMTAANGHFDTHSRYCAQTPASRLMHVMLTSRTRNTEPLLVGSLCSDRLPPVTVSAKIPSQALYAAADDLHSILT